ncbi:MAG: stage II sporulation protein P [Lachnospiraceae bacterium]|nr:stage II sporulation protein P [Lachnospiraceae bacterium]
MMVRGGRMGRRWTYFTWKLKRKRPMILGITGLLTVFCVLLKNHEAIKETMSGLYLRYGVYAAEAVMKHWSPKVLDYLDQLPKAREPGEDPAYERVMAGVWEAQILKENTSHQVTEQIIMETSGSSIIREKLADYDYLMKEFYAVHPSTTADDTLLNAETFLNMDLSIKREENPQILIYHTHFQETFADYPQKEDATIVGVGAYLTELLEERGYGVIHDTTVYDVKNGKLDRSQAYTYALEGIQGILQENPSIQVVLDLHRDGVEEGTHLVTEVNGKPTARIMFFNGTSQTPDGPIEYLPNPNREANLAFSFQMQLKAEEHYPGLTRKIYLKGLRYNQHVRARTALIEVGAQTNTYAEALNAMEPLADILCRVLDGA